VESVLGIAHSRRPDFERPAADRDLARFPGAVPVPAPASRITLIASPPEELFHFLLQGADQHALRALTRENVQGRAYFLLSNPRCGWYADTGVLLSPPRPGRSSVWYWILERVRHLNFHTSRL